MREIKYIVLHCTAGPQNQKIDEILNYWKSKMGWNRPGYHRIIQANGTVVPLSDYALPTNGVGGYNSNSIHICYTGGVDSTGQPVDNRTSAQKASMLQLVKELKLRHPKAKVCGHRDFPGVNKACPSFDVQTWLEQNGIG